MMKRRLPAGEGLASPLPPRALASGGEGSGVGGFLRRSLPGPAPPPRSPRVASLRCGERPSPPLRGGRVGARGAARGLSSRARLLRAIHACPIFDSQTGSRADMQGRRATTADLEPRMSRPLIAVTDSVFPSLDPARAALAHLDPELRMAKSA